MRGRGLISAALLVPFACWGQLQPLGSEFHVNTHTTSFQEIPQVAADSTGNFVVVWDSYTQDGSGHGIFAQRYDSDGAVLGTEFRVNTYTTADQNFPAIAADPNGNIVVVWQSFGQDGDRWGVFGKRLSSSGLAIGTEFQANTSTTYSQQHPAVATAANGDFVVAWESNNYTFLDVFARRFDSSGAPLGSEFQINTISAGWQSDPAVASDAAGNFVVVWTSTYNGMFPTEDGSGAGVFGQRIASNGAPLGTEFQVNTYTTGNQNYPAVASDASGGFIVAWENQLLSMNAQRYDSTGAPLGTEISVGSGSKPRVAIDSSGNSVVASDGDDGSNSGIFAQAYDSAGVPIGVALQVNTFTTGFQLGPDVVAGGGGFVVVWERFTNAEVWARRLSLEPVPTPTPSPGPSALDHYQCYQGTDRKSPEFTKMTISTADQLTNETVGVLKVKFVCVPVDKNGEGINDPSAHLTCYQINGESLSPRPKVQVSTQFQVGQFELKKPQLLCLPSTKTILP